MSFSPDSGQIHFSLWEEQFLERWDQSLEKRKESYAQEMVISHSASCPLGHKCNVSISSFLFY